MSEPPEAQRGGLEEKGLPPYAAGLGVSGESGAVPSLPGRFPPHPGPLPAFSACQLLASAPLLACVCTCFWFAEMLMFSCWAMPFPSSPPILCFSALCVHVCGEESMGDPTGTLGPQTPGKNFYSGCPGAS